MADANTKKYFLNAVKMQTVLTFWTCGHTNFVAICHDLACHRNEKRCQHFHFKIDDDKKKGF